jgi:signal transduction histidine kinase
LAGRRGHAPLTLLRSTPVRQALLLVAVVAAVNLVSLGGAYLKLRADLVQSIRTDIEEELSGFDLSATPRALSAIVEAKARATDPAKTVLVFLGEDGRQVGNARAVLAGQNLRLVEADRDHALGQAGYIHEARRLSSGILIVAESLAPISDLSNTFLSLLAFSLGPTVLISLGLGVLIARRTARRVEGIERTLDRLSAGDLTARTGTKDGAGDDLGRIGAGVNRLAARQEAATEALRQVTADIAHDLRTPLQRIAVLLHDLGGRLPQGSDAMPLAEQARDEVDRAVSVFHAMLQIAQIEGSNAAARFAPLDLRDTARQMVELYLPAVEDAGDTLVLELPPEPVTVTGDPHLIAQALANLVENALRHTPPGTRISVAVSGGPAGPRLTVADDGPGVPAEEREKVVRRLYRLERSRTTPGHGLGLSLVAAIATLHAATLTLEDNDPGLRARVDFPPAPPAGG